MERNDLVDRARQTLERTEIAALATISPDGLPWNSPLYVAFDRRLTFYWSSQRDSAHSRNISSNPEVFLVVFDSTAADQSGHGVYVRGTARELVDEPSVKAGLECLARRKQEPLKPVADFLGSQPRRVYELVPHVMWTNLLKERDGHYFDERVVIDRQSLQTI